MNVSLSSTSLDMEASSTNIISNIHGKQKLQSLASASDLQTLLSTAIRKPPSHILADGTFVHLPEPTKAERATFFERAVAQNRLVSATDENIDTTTKEDTDPTEEEDNQKRNTKKKKDDDVHKIHPIAIASARINGKGVQELSKAINLGDLVGFGEYFSLANIVNNANVNIGSMKEDVKDSKMLEKSTNSSDPSTKTDSNNNGSGGDNGNNGSSTESSSKNNSSTSNNSAGIDSAAILEEQKLRASYLLKHKHSQFLQSAQILKKQTDRLSKILIRQKIIDYRLLQLRKHWRLVAPEHGTRAMGPVRPTEVVAIDVEVYDRDRTGGGNVALMQSIHSTTNSSQKRQQQEQAFMKSNRPGKIARMVPRYATIDVRDGCEVDKSKLFPPKIKKRQKDKMMSSNEQKKGKMMNDNPDGNESDSSKNKNPPKTAFTNNLLNSNLLPNLTISEPFAVADPTLGKIDPDFDPDKVPILTLLMSIEKACTGYVQHCTLSSSSSSSPPPTSSSSNLLLSLTSMDEKVITTLQHSLFCASLFESIRREITTNSNTSKNTSNSSTSVWLSDGMEETFLPPPSHMTSNGTSGSSGLCVIHCHESEVKVRLDSEYSLSIQLIEAGTALDVTTNEKSKTNNKNESDESGSGSGSQSPEQLKVLCRTLLLQAQFMYHDYSMKNRTQAIVSKKNDESSKKKSSANTTTTATQLIPLSPHILEQCVALGSKTIFERKIRSTLQKLSKWMHIQVQNMKEEDIPKPLFTVEWLPLTLFDSNSHFVLSVADNSFCMDVSIRGSEMTVSQIGDDVGYQRVGFRSAMEFEYFVKFQIKRRVLPLMQTN